MVVVVVVVVHIYIYIYIYEVYHHYHYYCQIIAAVALGQFVGNYAGGWWNSEVHKFLLPSFFA